MQIISANQVEASYHMLQNEIQQGRISVDLVSFVEPPSPTTNDIHSKPWRRPPIASCSATHVDQTIAASSSTTASYDKYEAEHYIPICSRSVIPNEFLEEEPLDSDMHSAYTLSFSEGNAINPNENHSILLMPSTVIPLQHLSSIFEVSRRTARQEATESNKSEASAAAPLSLRPESLLNALPTDASCIKETVNAAFYVARQICRPLSISMQAHHNMMRTASLLAAEDGAGKTHFALLVSALARLHLGIATTYLDCNKLQSSPNLRMRNILDELSEAFEEAAAKGPTSLLVLDDLHFLVPNIDASNDDENDAMHHQQTNPALSAQVKLISDHLRHLFGQSPHMSVLATCNTATAVVPSLRSLQGFSSVFNVPSLDRSQRVQLFDAMVKRSGGELSSATGSRAADLVPSFGKKTEGYTPSDLLSLAGRIAHSAHVRELGRCSSDLVGNITLDTLQEALDDYTPMSQRSLQVSKEDAPVAWSGIGGLFRAKATLTDVILRPVRYSAIYKNAPISLPRGILLYGPSGCGKSLVVPALAKECNFSVVKCNGPELLDKYIGASEAKVRQLFSRAYAAAPCILFMDDFDALAPRRGSDHTGVTDRVVNQLLTFLDGVEEAGNKKGMVYIIGATSRPGELSH